MHGFSTPESELLTTEIYKKSSRKPWSSGILIWVFSLPHWVMTFSHSLLTQDFTQTGYIYTEMLRTTHYPLFQAPCIPTCRHCWSIMAPGKDKWWHLQPILLLFKGYFGKERKVTQSNPLMNMLMTDLLENTDDIYWERVFPHRVLSAEYTWVIWITYGRQIWNP